LDVCIVTFGDKLYVVFPGQILHLVKVVNRFLVSVGSCFIRQLVTSDQGFKRLFLVLSERSSVLCDCASLHSAEVLREGVMTIILGSSVLMDLNLVLFILLVVSILIGHEPLSEVICELNISIQTSSSDIVLSLIHKVFFTFL
jgi:hypothetical protein